LCAGYASYTPIRVTLQQLIYFLAAAEHRSFSQAALTLRLAQPSLSEQVRRLEAELRVPLFTRIGRGIELTEAGRALVPHARQVLTAVEEARLSVAEVRELKGGVASFGTFGTAPLYLLHGLVMDFRKRYPDVRVRLVGENSSAVADEVRDGSIEAGLVVLPIDDEGLDVRIAMRDEVLFASSRPERLRTPMTIERLATLPLVLASASYRREDPMRRQLAELAQRHGVRIEASIEVEDNMAALDLAARGLGDTLVARGITLGRRFPRGLGTTPFAEPIYDTFAFIQRRGAWLSPATRALLDLAEQRVATVAKRIGEGVAPRGDADPG